MNPQEALMEGLKKRVSQDELDKLILGVNKNIDFLGDSGFSPLHYAISHGTAETIAKLFKLNPNVNIVARNKTSPLHWAMMELNDTAADLLIKHGADLTQVDGHGNTPVHLYAVRGAQGGNQLLADHQGLMMRCMDKLNGQKYTPLHCAIDSDNLYFFSFFVNPLTHRYYGQIDLRSDAMLGRPNGETLVHRAITRVIHSELAKDDMERTYTFLYLLAGTEPTLFDEVNKDGYTPLDLLRSSKNKPELKKIYQLVENPYAIHRQTFANKELLGTMQVTLNGLRDENSTLKSDNVALRTELKEVSDQLKTLTQLVTTLTEQFNGPKKAESFLSNRGTGLFK